MARRDNYLHFRVDNELLEAIDAVAATTPENNRSQVCRMLLQQALGNEAGVEAVQQAIYETSGIRKRVSARLAQRSGRDRRGPRPGGAPRS
jgi:metal-responsive CopG/Arc/MetJ family transcriptional regulator